MGQSTSIHFYIKDSTPAPRGTLADIISWLEPTHLQVTRTAALDNSWNDLHAEGPEVFPEYELLMKPVSAEEAVRLYLPAKGYSLTIKSAIAHNLIEAVNKAIPEAIRGEHWPQNLDLRMNPHDIFEDGENTKGRLIARAFLSLRFWGYRTPKDFAQYRNSVLALPETIGIRERLTLILGAVECEVYMRL